MAGGKNKTVRDEKRRKLRAVLHLNLWKKKEKIFNCLFILLNLKEVMKREIWKYKKQNKNRFPEKKVLITINP